MRRDANLRNVSYEISGASRHRARFDQQAGDVLTAAGE